MENLIVLAGFLVLMYLLLIRPQQKQQKARRELIERVSVGDDVVTIGGLHGTVVEVGEGATGPFVDLLVTEDVVLRFKRESVSAIAGGGEDASEESDDVAAGLDEDDA